MQKKTKERPRGPSLSKKSVVPAGSKPSSKKPKKAASTIQQQPVEALKEEVEASAVGRHEQSDPACSADLIQGIEEVSATDGKQELNEKEVDKIEVDKDKKEVEEGLGEVKPQGDEEQSPAEPLQGIPLEPVDQLPTHPPALDQTHSPQSPQEKANDAPLSERSNQPPKAANEEHPGDSTEPTPLVISQKDPVFAEVMVIHEEEAVLADVYGVTNPPGGDGTHFDDNNNNMEHKSETGLDNLEQILTQGEHLNEALAKSKSFAQTDMLAAEEPTSLRNLQKGTSDDAQTTKDQKKESNPQYFEGDHIIGFMDELEEIQPVNTLDVRDDQFSIIQETWAEVKSKGTQEVGVKLMMTIFELEPASRSLFSFGNLPDIAESQELLQHASRLLNTLDEAISEVSNLAKSQPKLKQLGKQHFKNGVLKEHFNVVGQALMQTLGWALGERFGQAQKQAWVRLIRQISAYMISDNFEEKPDRAEEILNDLSSYYPSPAPKREPATPDQVVDLTTPELPFEQPRLPQDQERPQTVASPEQSEPRPQDARSDSGLPASKIELIQNSWKAVTSSGSGVGKGIFKTVFHQNPEISRLFNRHNKGLDAGEVAEKFSPKFMRSVTVVIESLGKPEIHESLLIRLGEAHTTSGVEPKHYEMLFTTLVEVMQEILGESFDEETRSAWEAGISLISQLMASSAQNKNESQQQQTPPELKESSAKSKRLRDEYLNKSFLSVENIGDVGDLHDQIKRENTLFDSLSQKQMPVQKKETEVARLTFMGSTQLITKEVEQHYKSKIQKEVDFHHKLQFRFEKAYRLGKKLPESQGMFNLELIDLISEFSGFIEHDKMAVFYCLYFCIFYNNAQLVEFFRSLMIKLPTNPKADQLMEYIDVYGIRDLRSAGSQINSLVYHMVFYQAVDDSLRIVYSQILSKLRFIQLRDKDALHLLNKRDYELIRLSFSKYTTKVNLLQFYPKASQTLKASTYRQYNQAFYEEIVISNEIEERVAQNYRERFLVTAEDIYIVFEMYCKEDYDEQFQSTRKDDITHKQFVELFVICLRNDSFKIAFLIYTLYLAPSEDIDERILDIIITTLRDSVHFHELKLFFLHDHFQKLTITQMNRLVDIYSEILNRKPEQNPMLNQFNTIKIALLIYRICWRIEGRQIYSLITKCTALQNYLMASLVKYLEKQTNVLVLLKFMTEPILHVIECQDSLDIMQEMNMQKLLQHPVIVEVLNLVYEGKFSISSSALSMSQTFHCLFEMETFSQKSVSKRMVRNIMEIGSVDNKKQSSLQYNIWKHSIQQREKDEMVFSVLVNSLIIGLSILLIIHINQTFSAAREQFGVDLFSYTAVFLSNTLPTIGEFCHHQTSRLVAEMTLLNTLSAFIALNSLGVLANLIQKMFVFRFKENVQFDLVRLLHEVGIVLTGFLFFMARWSSEENTLIGDTCKSHVDLTISELEVIDTLYALRNPDWNKIDFSLIISLIVVQSTLETISKLRRTQQLNALITMLTYQIEEMTRFFATFGIVIGLFFFVGYILSSEFKSKAEPPFQVMIDLFDSVLGTIDYSSFTTSGQAFEISFMFLFKVLLLSLLTAMFVNKYRNLYKSIDAFKRFEIISMKNSEGYDKYIGGASLSFYPVNILIVPFLLPIMVARSRRLSDFALKIQYVIMMMLYLGLSLALVVPAVPLLYLKSVMNGAYIFFTRHREDFPGQNWIQLVSTVLLSPLILVGSFFVDILTLPDILMKPSINLEHKYQFLDTHMTPGQIETMQGAFTLVFSNYETKWKGKQVTLLQLMEMHRLKFRLIDNLHNLICLGNLNAADALSNVQEYNLSKFLSVRCSIPDPSGQFKLGRVDIGMIYTIFKDADLYNYADIVIRKLRMGVLRDEIAEKENSLSISKGRETPKPRELSAIQVEARKVAQRRKEKERIQKILEEDSDGDIANSMFHLSGPDSAPLWRNQNNLMNNYFIDRAASSFTDVDDLIRKERNSQKREKFKQQEKAFAQKQERFKEQTIGLFEQRAKKFTSILKNKTYGFQMEMMKVRDEILKKRTSLLQQETIAEKKEEASTTSSIQFK